MTNKGITKEYLDFLGVVRIFCRFDHDQRALMQSSHRLGYRQKQRVGEYRWTTSYVPHIAYMTRGAAIAAAEAALQSQLAESA